MRYIYLLAVAILCVATVSCTSEATLDVKVNVKDAEVYVNQKLAGKAPITLTLESGESNIEVRKNGYVDYKGKVKLESGTKRALNVNLKALASVTLLVDADVEDAEVYLNGKLVGNTPLEKKLRAGNADIVVKKDGYEDYSESVTLSANSTRSIDATLMTSNEAIFQREEAQYAVNDEGLFTDLRDGKQYKWLKIKNKIWMVENLNYRVRNRSWCYDKDPDNCIKYGRLYSQRGALEAAEIGGAWHLPSDDEWKAFYDYYNASDEGAYASLKDGGILGFNATLGGNFNYFSEYTNLNEIGYYWSSTKDETCNTCGFSWVFDSTNETIYRNTENFSSMGFSVRLVRDVE